MIEVLVVVTQLTSNFAKPVNIEVNSFINGFKTSCKLQPDLMRDYRG